MFVVTTVDCTSFLSNPDQVRQLARWILGSRDKKAELARDTMRVKRQTNPSELALKMAYRHLFDPNVDPSSLISAYLAAQRR